MRKVLLTTTALVALGGVSAASALDITGYQRFSHHLGMTQVEQPKQVVQTIQVSMTDNA